MIRSIAVITACAIVAVVFIVVGEADPRHWPKTSAVLAFLPGLSERYVKPDEAEMRRYVVSKLTDAQLLELKRKGDEAFRQDRAASAANRTAYWAGRDARARECESNPANALRRSHSCSEPLPLVSNFDDFSYRSPEEAFEHLLTRYCSLMYSVYEARQKGCLPP